MMDTAGKDFLQAEQRYRRNFDWSVRSAGATMAPDDLVFSRKYHFGRRKNKL